MLCVYVLCTEVPLILYDSVYEGVEWRRCERTYLNVVSHFQRMWTEMAVKSVNFCIILLHIIIPS